MNIRSTILFNDLNLCRLMLDTKKLSSVILTHPSTHPTPSYRFESNIQKSIDQDTSKRTKKKKVQVSIENMKNQGMRIGMSYDQRRWVNVASSKIPATFREWTTNNGETMLTERNISAEDALVLDIFDYATYLREGPFDNDSSPSSGGEWTRCAPQNVSISTSSR